MTNTCPIFVVAQQLAQSVTTDKSAEPPQSVRAYPGYKKRVAKNYSCAQDRTRTTESKRGYLMAQTIGRAINLLSSAQPTHREQCYLFTTIHTDALQSKCLSFGVQQSLLGVANRTTSISLFTDTSVCNINKGLLLRESLSAQDRTRTYMP